MLHFPPQAICVNNLQVVKLERNIMDHGKCIATSKQTGKWVFFYFSNWHYHIKKKKYILCHKLKSNFKIHVFTKCTQMPERTERVADEL